MAGAFNPSLHPRLGGRFTTSGGTRRRVSIVQARHIASPGGGGGGGKGGKTGRTAKGPNKAEISMIGQVEAGNIYTTDGGKTWSLLGSKTPGSATRAVLRAEKDGLLAGPGKGSNRPAVTKAGAAAFKRSGKQVPTAKAPLLARTAANKQARAAAAQRAATRRATAAAAKTAAANARAASTTPPGVPAPRPMSARSVVTRRAGHR